MVIMFAIIQNAKDRSRLEALYIEHASCMYKIANKILNDEYLAQDAVQEAFIKIAINLNKIKENDCNKTRALFVIIVRNISIDIYRRRKKHHNFSIEEMEVDLPNSEPSVEEILMNNESLFMVTEKIKELHPSYADVLALKYFFQYEDVEISTILNITPENLRTRLHRARHSLIKLLSQEQEAIEGEATTICKRTS